MTTATQERIPEFTVADRCRKARETAGFEQAALAELMGVSRETVSNYERGKVQPRRIVINAWALATGVPVAWLRDGWAPRGSNPEPTVLKSSQVVELRPAHPAVDRVERIAS